MIAAIHPTVLAFFAGNLSVHCLPVLPPPWLLLLAGISGIIVFIPSHLSRTYGAFVIGFCWTAWVATAHSDDILASDLEGESVSFSGEVATIPKQYAEGFSFIFQTDEGGSYQLPNYLYLKIYTADTPVTLHSKLQLTARLKRPYGYVNRGLFDYEKWLFARRIGGSGYVYKYRIVDTPARRAGIGYLRQELVRHLKQKQSLTYGESIAALGLGFSGALSKQKNDLLIATGTRHLFAVSGLHINLVFGFFVLIIRALWSRTLLVRTQYPASLAALWGALPLALCYAFLVGFSLPTQRALIMLTCFVAGWQLRKQMPMAQLLAVALFAVIIYDPLSTLSASFWLSFAAVALIIFYLSNVRYQKKWYHWGALQTYLSLSMGLLTMLLFSRGAVAAPLVNLFAVPFIGVLLLPACLMSIAALWVAKTSPPTELMLTATDWLFSVFWTGIGWFAAHDLEWFWQPPWWVFGFALVGILLSIVLTEAKHKLFALLLLLPLVVNQHSDAVKFGDFKADFLDVGQGLSVLVRTQKHALLFDTGPSFRSGFNTGEAVGIPYLRSLGIATLDKLIVSHSDNDHAGSVDAIRRTVHIGEILSGEPLDIDEISDSTGIQRCQNRHSWTWDGVHFKILHPTVGSVWTGNNASCVLRISNGDHSLLLTGDIEAAAEETLVGHPYGASDIMLVPHHGSRTSSSVEFIRTVSPKVAIVTSGYRNRYGFPLPDILERYRGVEVYNTAIDGMISLSALRGAPIDIVAWRRASHKYWRHQADGAHKRF